MLDTHRRAPAFSASPVARIAWDAHSLAVRRPELSFEDPTSALELPSLQPTPQHTYMSCMHDLAINTEETMIRLLAAVLSLNKPLLHTVQTDSRIQTLAQPNRK